KTYLKAGKKVTLKVNGKTYTAKTNAKGVAKFTIKLTKKGKYAAKVSFAGDKTYSASSKKIMVTIK
ncbi:Ig-like domain-containing protein, partial [Methanobrevibacter sp.]|uniref:Ig-like domain-containing protein n=1 Tax=Methanobrevibacter sp. TaxID=66852 RepID=UPI00386AB157